jgi:hypothetical protein
VVVAREVLEEPGDKGASTRCRCEHVGAGAGASAGMQLLACKCKCGVQACKYLATSFAASSSVFSFFLCSC